MLVVYDPRAGVKIIFSHGMRKIKIDSATRDLLHEGSHAVLKPEVSEALPQSNGFLRSYVEYISQCSDAPPTYHVAVGLSIFSAAVARNVVCAWNAGRQLMPNIYTLIIGPSRTTRKTASLDAGTDILQLACPELLMPMPGSYEEMVEQMRRQAHGLLTFREFGHFLKQTQRGYAEPQRTLLMDLYDWPCNRPYTRNLKKGQIAIEGPICLSMLGAVSTDLLYQNVDSSEWLGGFFGRLFLIYGERDEFKMPSTWEAARNYLVGQLRAWSGYKPPPCGGFSSDAWIWLDAWARARDSETSKLPLRIQNFCGGTLTFAAKIALLYALDSGECGAGEGWLISLQSVYRAVRFVEDLYLKSAVYLGEHIQLSLWERARQQVIDIIETAGDFGVSRRDLLRKTKLPTDQADSITESLRDAGIIGQVQRTNGMVYRVLHKHELHRIVPTGAEVFGLGHPAANFVR